MVSGWDFACQVVHYSCKRCWHGKGLGSEASRPWGLNFDLFKSLWFQVEIRHVRLFKSQVKGVGMEKALDPRPSIRGLTALGFKFWFVLKFMVSGWVSACQVVQISCERCWLGEGLGSEASWPWALMFDMIQVFGFRLSVGMPGFNLMFDLISSFKFQVEFWNARWFRFTWKVLAWRRPRIWTSRPWGLIFDLFSSLWFQVESRHYRWFRFHVGGATLEKASDLRPHDLGDWFLICFQVYGFRLSLGMPSGFDFMWEGPFWERPRIRGFMALRFDF